MSQMIQQPTHYTIVEGGHWHVWPSWVDLTTLDLEARDPVSIMMNKGYEEPWPIHSLAFTNTQRPPTGVFPRWDCINGYSWAR